MRPYQITEDEFFAAHALHRGWRPLITAVLVSAAYATYAFRRIEIEGAVILTGTVVLILFLLPPWIRKFRLRRIFNEQQTLHETFTVTFDDERVTWDCESGNARIRWENFTRFKEDANIFILFESRNLMRIVPKQVFDDDEELARFRAKLAYIGMS